MQRIYMNINDKDYELRFDINSLIDLADNGIDVMNLGDVKLDMRAIRTMFKYAIKHDNKKITDNQAGELISEFINEGHTFNDVIERVLQALAYALGSKEEEKNEVEEGKQ